MSRRGRERPDEREAEQRFAICIANADYPASLEVRKVYAVLTDPEAEARGMLRVIDESGEDYLYPASLFEAVELSPAAKRALASG